MKKWVNDHTGGAVSKLVVQVKDHVAAWVCADIGEGQDRGWRTLAGISSAPLKRISG